MTDARSGATAGCAGARALPIAELRCAAAGTAVDLVVLHKISLPPGGYGGDAIERLFTNRLDRERIRTSQAIRGLEVSAHFLVRRDGELVQFVSCGERAWHAGASSWRRARPLQRLLDRRRARGRRRRAASTSAQYRVLGALVAQPRSALSDRDVAGHSDVAPGRKTDPGPCFDWPHLRRIVRAAGAACRGLNPAMRDGRCRARVRGHNRRTIDS